MRQGIALKQLESGEVLLVPKDSAVPVTCSTSVSMFRSLITTEFIERVSTLVVGMVAMLEQQQRPHFISSYHPL